MLNMLRIQNESVLAIVYLFSFFLDCNNKVPRDLEPFNLCVLKRIPNKKKGRFPNLEKYVINSKILQTFFFL